MHRDLTQKMIIFAKKSTSSDLCVNGCYSRKRASACSQPSRDEKILMKVDKELHFSVNLAFI